MGLDGWSLDGVLSLSLHRRLSDRDFGVPVSVTFVEALATFEKRAETLRGLAHLNDAARITKVWPVVHLAFSYDLGGNILWNLDGIKFMQ